MDIALGCDHRGLNLKQAIMDFLAEAGHSYQDFGCCDTSPVDYPDIAREVAQGVASGKFNRGVLICSTGIGMSIAANKMPGVRAAPCHESFSARRAREHNDANVLCLGASVIGQGLAEDIVAVFLSTEFQGGRHVRRLEKIKALESKG